MGKESAGRGKGDSPNTPKSKARETAKEAGLGAGWVREDGAICFGDECVVLKPQDNGKLHMEVKPTRCGEETGRILLDHLVKTAGKGVVIEIPSEVEQDKGR